MKSNPNENSPLSLPVLLILALLVVVICSITAYASWDENSIKNDGVQYLSTAKNIVNGYGLVTDTLAFGSHFQGEIPGPQTMWPPGYPALIAFVASFTGDFERAALSIGIVALFIGALLIGLLLLRCGLSRLWALMGASLFYLTFFQWQFVAGLLSEPVFSASILASLYALPAVKSARHGRYLLCGVLLAAVLLVRYSAVIFIAGVGIGVFILLGLQVMRRAETIKGLIIKCILLGAPGVLLFAGLMLRVRLTTSGAVGVSGAQTPGNLYDYLSTVFSEIGWFLSFYTYGDGIPVIIGKLLTLVFLALISVWIVLSLGQWLLNARPGAGSGNQRLDHDHSTLRSAVFDKRKDFRTVLSVVVIVHTVLFFLYFGYCMMTDIPLRLSRRYFFQIHSGLLVLFLLTIFAGARTAQGSVTSRGGRRNQFFGLIVLVLFAVGQVHGITGVFLAKQRNSELHRMLDLPIAGIAGDVVGGHKSGLTVRKLVDNCFNIDSANPANLNQVKRDEGVIWSDQGQTLHQYLRVPTISLTNRYREAAIDFAQLSSEVETYNIRMLIMVPLWAMENAWKIPGILQWAASQNMPVLEVSGYDKDLSRNTFVVFADPHCAPGGQI